MFIWTSVLLSYSQVPGNTAQPTICPSSVIVRCLFNSLTSMMDWQICLISARYMKIHFLLGATFCLLACFCFLFFAFQLWEMGPAQEVSRVFRATAPGKGGASWAFPCIPIWAAVFIYDHLFRGTQYYSIHLYVYSYDSTTLSWLLKLCSKFYSPIVRAHWLCSCFLKLFWLLWILYNLNWFLKSKWKVLLSPLSHFVALFAFCLITHKKKLINYLKK